MHCSLRTLELVFVYDAESWRIRSMAVILAYLKRFFLLSYVRNSDNLNIATP